MELNVNTSKASKSPSGILKTKKSRQLPLKSELPPGDVRRMIATNNLQECYNDKGERTGYFLHAVSNKTNNNNNRKVTMARFSRFDSIPISDDDTVRSVSNILQYSVTKRFVKALFALIDRGANGGVAGNDMRLMHYHRDNIRVNIGGVGDHLINGKRLGTFTAVILTQLGYVIAWFYNYAHIPEQSNTIHSSVQLEDYKLLISDTCI